MHTPLGSSRSDGFNYHLNVDDSQISSPSLDLSPFLQSHISFCPQNISTWVSHHLLKLNMSETKLIISPRPPSFSPCFSGTVNGTLSLGSNPKRSQVGTGQSVSPMWGLKCAVFCPHIPTQMKKCSPASLGISERDFERTFRCELNLLQLFCFFYLLSYSSKC